MKAAAIVMSNSCFIYSQIEKKLCVNAQSFFTFLHKILKKFHDIS